MADMYRNLHVSEIETFGSGNTDAKNSYFYCLEVVFKLYIPMWTLFRSDFESLQAFWVSNISCCAVP